MVQPDHCLELWDTSFEVHVTHSTYRLHAVASLSIPIFPLKSEHTTLACHAIPLNDSPTPHGLQLHNRAHFRVPHLTPRVLPTLRILPNPYLPPKAPGARPAVAPRSAATHAGHVQASQKPPAWTTSASSEPKADLEGLLKQHGLEELSAMLQATQTSMQQYQ